jgi:hypothetical protein
MTSQQAADASPLTDKASDLAFLDNIDELNTAWPDYQVSHESRHGEQQAAESTPQVAHYTVARWPLYRRTFKMPLKMFLAQLVGSAARQGTKDHHNLQSFITGHHGGKLPATVCTTL